MQNKLIAAVSSVVTDPIRKEIGNTWYTIKVDDTKEQTGVEKISTIIRFVNDLFLKEAESFLVLSNTDSGSAKSITYVILVELRTASSKILS